MKRPNGTGSVYRIKNRKLRKPYVAVYTKGWHVDGTRKRQIIGYFERASDAQMALAEYQYNPDKYDNKYITFGDVWEWMIEEKKRNGVDIVKGKYSTIKKKLEPILSLPMQQIRLSHLQAIFDKYNHLGRSSHEAMLKAVNGVFKEAIKNDVINKNYTPFITIPAREKSTLHKPFSTEEIQILWKHTDRKLVKILLIYIYTGLRPVELFKIKLSDVFITDRYMIGGVKTTAGKNRMIPLATCIMPFVEELYNIASVQQSETLIPKGYVPERYDRQLVALCEELNLMDHRRHDTRHTFITLCSNAGIDEYIIKEIVGHSHSGNITRDVYIHKSIQQLIQKIDRIYVP